MKPIWIRDGLNRTCPQEHGLGIPSPAKRESILADSFIYKPLGIPIRSGWDML